MVIVFLFLLFISLMLIITDREDEFMKWFSATAFFSSLSALAVLLEENIRIDLSQGIGIAINVFIQFLYSVSYCVTSVCYLFAVLSYAKPDFWNKHKKKIISLAFIPCISMYFIFPFYPKYMPDFVILSIWVVMYVLFSNALLIQHFFKEQTLRIRRQILKTMLLSIPPTMYCLLTCYFLRAFKIDVWRTNMWSIAFMFILFVVLGTKGGVLGVKLNFEKSNFDKTMKAITSGTSMLNHTIKNEITKISMSLNNIKYHVETVNEDVEESFNVITQSTEHMMNMVSRMQNHVREIEIREEWHSLSEIIKSSLEGLKVYLGKKGIQVEYHFDCDYTFLCDVVHIKEVINNIIKNSIEALNAEGEIQISVFCNRKMTGVVFVDNGVGIPQECMDRLFEPFFSTKRMGVNFGLGLWYAHNVMKRHQGFIDVTSKEKMGTKVILWFPRKRVRGEV